MAMTDDEQTAYDNFRKTVDVSVFTNAPYVRRIEKPWGYEIHFVPDNAPYMGKLEVLNEGAQNSLQVHDKKQESWYWGGGNPIVVIENQNGEMEEIHLKPGQGYTCKIGQKHRLKGGEGGGTFIEVSTPEQGTTFRLEDDYSRPSETEELREKRNQEGRN